MSTKQTWCVLDSVQKYQWSLSKSLDPAILAYANEIEFCILQELAYRNFIKFAGVFAIVSQFNDLEFLPSGSEKANSFAGVFSENSNFDDTGHSPLV